MNVNMVNLGMVAGGGVLIYGAIKDVSPLDVVKAAVTNQPLPQKAPDSGSGDNSGDKKLPITPGTIPLPKLPSLPHIPGLNPTQSPGVEAYKKIKDLVSKWLG